MKKLFLFLFLTFCFISSALSQPLSAYRLDPYLFDGGLYGRLTTKRGVEPTLKALQDKLTADPKDFATQSDIGSIYFFQARYREAVEAYLKAIELAALPKDKVYYNLGMAYFAKAEYPQAEGAFRTRLELDPKDTFTWALYGVTLMMKKDYAGAQTALEKALTLDPEMNSARINLGVVFYYEGKKELAQREFAAVAQAGTWPQAHYNLALIYKEQGRNKEAAREFEIYLQKRPDAPDYRVILKEVERLRR